MKRFSEEQLFRIGMWWRMGYGVLRILFAIAILKIVGMPLVDVVHTLMSHELIEDPNDLLYRSISNLLENHPLYISCFLSAYFAFWGCVDIFLSYSLLRHRMWAFPVSYAVIGFFVVYELVRFTHTHSAVLLLVTFVDIVILKLIRDEHKRLVTRTAS